MLMSGHHSKLNLVQDPGKLSCTYLRTDPNTNPECGGSGIYPLTPIPQWLKVAFGSIILQVIMQCKTSTLLNWTQLELTTALRHNISTMSNKLRYFITRQRNYIKNTVRCKQFQGNTLISLFVKQLHIDIILIKYPENVSYSSCCGREQIQELSLYSNIIPYSKLLQPAQSFFWNRYLSESFFKS